MRQTFSVVIHREEDMFVAECPETGTMKSILRQAGISEEEFSRYV